MRRLVASFLCLLIVLEVFPAGVAAKDTRPWESKRLHFDLQQDGFLDPSEDYHLHLNGQRIILQRHTEATLAGFRAGSPGAKHEPSHYGDVRLPADRVVMMYVTQRSDRSGQLAAAQGPRVDHGLALPIIHVPNVARRAALMRVKTGRVKAQSGAVGCATDLNNDGAITEEELNTYTPCDVAKTILYHHPQAINFDASQGATVMSYIENAPGLDSLAIFIKSQGQHGWYTMPPILNADGTQFRRTDDGAPMFSYQINPSVNRAATTALKYTVIALTNDASLAGSSYSVVNGMAGVTQGSAVATMTAPKPKQDTSGTAFTLSNLGPQSGIAVSVDAVSDQSVTVGFTNYYVRHLTLYVQFYDDADNLVTPTGWVSQLSNYDFDQGDDPGSGSSTGSSHHENDTTKFLTLINPPQTFMGIPIGATGVNDVTFTMPSNAAYAKLLAGGLGTGGDRNSMIEEIGVALTATFELGIPGLLLLTTAALPDAATALQTLYRANAVISGVVKLFFSLIWSQSDHHSTATILESAATFLGNIIVQTGFQQIATLLVFAVADTAVNDALPFAGWIMNALNIANTVALLAEATYAVSTSPWIYENKLLAKHDIDVVISHDPTDFQFPATATHYVAKATFTDSDVRTSGPVPLPVSAPITYTFRGVPSGNTVDISVGFYSADGWLAGAANMKKGVVNLTPSGQAAQEIDLTIQECLVPLDASSVYTHKQKLVYAGGMHQWQAGPAPTATLATLDPRETGNALSELGNISLSQGVGAASYVWRSFSSGVTNCLSSGATGQLYTYQNISLTQNPETGLAFSGCGTSVKPYVILDLLNTDGTGNNFVIAPASDGSFYVRKFVLDSSGSFNLSASQSFGIFPTQLDSAAWHPKSYILGINRSTSKIYRVAVGAAAVDDIAAPAALMFAGPATSLAGAEANPNLLVNPRAVAIGTDGQLIVLEDISTITAGTSSSTSTGRLRAFDESGNPITYFNGNYGAVLTPETSPVTYLDVGIEYAGYIYVLSYVSPGHDVADYRMDIYNPDGSFLARTTGVAAARFAVDRWRNVDTLNFETIVGAGGRTEPSVSEWIPPTPPPTVPLPPGSLLCNQTAQ